MTADVLAWILLTAVAAYACGGGVDYGAGFWDLVAGGAERGRRPRWLIDHAMAPVWEVNNVRLIFVLVLMWTGFPVFFQTVFTAMWLPLALAAVGLLLRGAGFALRKPARRLAARRVYGSVFAVSSVVTPFFFGAVVGGVVVLVVAAWGFARKPYLVPTSLTVQQAAGADGPLKWLLFVSAVAVVLIGPALVVLYRLDTHGVLEPLTDADVAGGRGPGEGAGP